MVVRLCGSVMFLSCRSPENMSLPRTVRPSESVTSLSDPHELNVFLPIVSSVLGTVSRLSARQDMNAMSPNSRRPSGRSSCVRP